MNKSSARHSAYLLLLSLLVAAAPAWAGQVRIAIRAIKGSDQAMLQWQATADYLSRAIPEHQFIIVPFENNSALNQAVSQGDYAFCLTNPAAAIELKMRYGHIPLATLLNKRHGKGYSHFGAVIFTRADRHDIVELKDLKGKTFLGVDELGFGGWRMAWYELLKHGIDPYQEFKELRFAGGNQKTVVYAVLQGTVDAGAVRTDMLEGMAEESEISLSAFKVLGAKQQKGFPFLLSTDLYPEWSFSAAQSTPADLRQAVTRALLAINVNDEAAEKGNYMGWIPPADYTPVEKLLRELQVGPFPVTKIGLLKEFAQQYLPGLLASLAAFTALAIAFIYVTTLNGRIRQAQTGLKIEIANRMRAEQALTTLAQQSLEVAKESDFFKHCLTDLAQLFGTKYAYIALFSNAEKTHVKTCAFLEGDRFIDDFEYALVGTPCEDVLNSRMEFVPKEAFRKYPADVLLKQMRIESYFGAPLISPAGETIGLIALMDTKPMNPDNNFRPILRVFANRIALEMQRKQEGEALQGMAEQLSYEASHDPLTNLINRREFEVRMRSAWESAKTQNKFHVFCYLDLDQFKVVNDTCGHRGGDELLKQISATLSDIVRGSDTLARLGGDEFGVLLLDCPLDRAGEIAESILAAVKNYRFFCADNTFEVGISIGLAPIHAASGEMHEIFQAADSACYIAKSLGKNRIHIFVGDAREADKPV